MVKVKANAALRAEIISVADIFRAKIVDVAPDSLMVELTGNEAKLAAFIELLQGYTIKEIARTGITGDQVQAAAAQQFKIQFLRSRIGAETGNCEFQRSHALSSQMASMHSPMKLRCSWLMGWLFCS